MISDRSPVPRGQSYPLKRTDLEAALTDSEIENVAGVRWIKRGISIYQTFDSRGLTVAGIDAAYHGNNPPSRVHPHSPGRVWLTVYSVPSSERHAAEARLREDALPRLTTWLRRVQGASETWRREPHEYRLFFYDGRIRELEPDRPESYGP